MSSTSTCSKRSASDPCSERMADYQLPRDVTRAGPQRSWVAGKVVSMRQRDLDDLGGSQSTQASQATRGAGKIKGKGKKGKVNKRVTHCAPVLFVRRHISRGCHPVRGLGRTRAHDAPTSDQGGGDGSCQEMLGDGVYREDVSLHLLTPAFVVETHA